MVGVSFLLFVWQPWGDSVLHVIVCQMEVAPQVVMFLSLIGGDRCC